MDEQDIEAAAQNAARRDGRLPAIAHEIRPLYWPKWSARSAVQRVCQQLNPADATNPLQARVWFAVLRDTGDDEMLAQVIDIHREGRARRLTRERDAAVAEAELGRRRPLLVRPNRRRTDAA